MKKVIFIEDRSNYTGMCSGCRLCELMCAFEHHGVGNARLARIKVVSLRYGVKVPVVCQQCSDAPCAAACPTSALTRSRDDGPVTVNQGRCIGCGICVNVCPVGGISMDFKTGVAVKCDLCGGEPQCVKYCPSGVLKLSTEQQLANIKRKRYADSLTELGQECKQ